MNGYDIQSTLLYLKILYITICKEIHYNDLCTCFDTGTVLGCLWRLSCNTASLLFAILGCFRGVVLRVDTFLCRSFFFGFLDVLVHCHSIPSSQEPRCVSKRERFYKNKEHNAVRKPELKECQLYDQKEKKNKLWKLSFMARVPTAEFFQTSSSVSIRQMFTKYFFFIAPKTAWFEKGGG